MKSEEHKQKKDDHDIFSDLNKLNPVSDEWSKEHPKIKKENIKEKIRKLPIKMSILKHKKWSNFLLDKKVDLHINTSFNNTKLVAITEDGRVIQHITAGMLGQNNTKRGMIFSAKKTAETMCDILFILGVEKINKIYTSGENRNNKIFALTTVINMIKENNITEIIDITSKKFNGIRLPRKRRV